MNTGRRRRSGANHKRDYDDSCAGEDEARDLQDKVEHLTLSMLRRGVEGNGRNPTILTTSTTTPWTTVFTAVSLNIHIDTSVTAHLSIFKHVCNLSGEFRECRFVECSVNGSRDPTISMMLWHNSEPDGTSRDELRWKNLSTHAGTQKYGYDVGTHR